MGDILAVVSAPQILPVPICLSGADPSLGPTAHAGALCPLRSQKREGPTGLDVGGYRPTSPKGWNTMMQALRESNVGSGERGGCRK